MKIKVHSFVDVITNSSTVIYTSSANCIGPVRELIAEIFKFNNITDNIDDIFDIKLNVDADQYMDRYEDEVEDYDENDPERYVEYFSLPEDDWSAKGKFIDNIVQAVYNDKLPKPRWMESMENEMQCSSRVSIVAKDVKYENIAKLIHKVLYSTSCDAYYNG